MYKIIYPIILGLIVACGNPNSSSNQSEEQAWYKGGNLHKAKIKEWKAAEDKNKLATCADFIARIDKSPSLEDLFTKSVELKACINEATNGFYQ